MKKILFYSIIVLLFSSFVNQSSEVFTNNKLSIKASEVGCNDIKNGTNKEYVFLTFQNKTANTIKVSFLTEVYYDNTCYSCNNETEFTQTIELKPNEIISGDCTNKSVSNSIFSKMLDGVSNSRLTSYAIKDVVIKTK
jgi:hypothetical protein